MIKFKLLPLCFTLMVLFIYKTGKSQQSSLPETGTIKVTILYPNGEDKNFDMDYYEKNHMPMMAGFLGKNLKFYEIDKGISGRTPNDKAPFVAIGYFYISDLAEYNKAIVQNIDTIRKDINKYTNIQPAIQISEIRKFGYSKTK